MTTTLDVLVATPRFDQAMNNHAGAVAAAFLSHSTADRATVEVIDQALNSRGVSTWVSYRDIRPGSVYAEELESDNPDHPQLVIVLISKNANASKESS